MIARVWRGWTEPRDADAYDAFLRTELFPAMGREVPGFRGGYVLRRHDWEEDEFLVITMFDSIEDVRAFAGERIDVPVIEPRAKALLSRGEEHAVHYRVEPTPREAGRRPVEGRSP